MGRTQRNQTNSASLSILLRSVSIVYHSNSNAVTDPCAMVQLPPRLRWLSGQENWKPVKDEIRRVADMHGLADISNEALDVAVCDGHGSLYANCQFTNREDAREVFSMCIGGRCFQNLANSVLDRTDPRSCVRGLCTASMVIRTLSKRAQFPRWA